MAQWNQQLPAIPPPPTSSLSTSLLFPNPLIPNPTLPPAPTDLLVNWAKVSCRATGPLRSDIDSSGYLIASAYPTTIPARGQATVLTDLSIIIPTGLIGFISARPTPSLLTSSGVQVETVPLTRGYINNLSMVLFNHTQVDYVVKPGEFVAQLTLYLEPMHKLQEWDCLNSCPSLPRFFLSGLTPTSSSISTGTPYKRSSEPKFNITLPITTEEVTPTTTTIASPIPSCPGT